VEYLSSDAKTPATGKKHVMDCIDCHSRPAHSFDTPEGALNKAMVHGRLNTSLPFIRKQGLVLIKAEYASQADAESKITAGLEDFYRTNYPDIFSKNRSQIEDASKALSAIYARMCFLS
jgi:hypothetical protein